MPQAQTANPNRRPKLPKFVFMPPQDDLKAMFAARLADTVPEYDVATPETDDEALEAIRDADAACGWVPPAALRVRHQAALAAQPRRRPLLRILLPGADRPPAHHHQPARHLLRPHIAPHNDVRVRAVARTAMVRRRPAPPCLGQGRPPDALHILGRGDRAHQRRSAE